MSLATDAKVHQLEVLVDDLSKRVEAMESLFRENTEPTPAVMPEKRKPGRPPWKNLS